MVNAEFAIPEDNILSTDDEASSEESFSAEFEDQSIAYSGVDLEQKNEAAAELSTDDINTRPFESISDSNESIPEDKNDDQSSWDGATEQIIEMLNKLEGMFAAKIDRSEYELETLKKQSEEIQEYKADLYASILASVLRPLVKTHAYMKRAILKTQASGADSIPLDEFEFAYDDVNDVIEDSGVEIRSFEKGDLFESNYMKISGQNKVVEPEKNKTVSVVSSDAYIFKNTVLEKARTVVNVYSDEQSLAQNE